VLGLGLCGGLIFVVGLGFCGQGRRYGHSYARI
jgi:hypothetical protein